MDDYEDLDKYDVEPDPFAVPEVAAEIKRLTAERDALSDRVFGLECVIASARAALDRASAKGGE
jgi:hypothetical protein